MRDVKCRVFYFLVLSFLIGAHSAAAQDFVSAQELKRLSLEQLLDVQVTIASRKPQAYAEVASAIDVLTAERIRRTGATNIPDALRIAVGLNVARSDGRTWAITARGLNLNTANKLLVMQDGRTLYTPLFSGVFWDVQDTFLEDIDRIEVLRGPGATQWGANAINGVINIITKHASQTLDSVFVGIAGNEERGNAGMRYGAKFGNQSYYRAYLKLFSRDDLRLASGAAAEDDWLMGRAGFRMDSRLSDIDNFTLQGDIYRGDLGLIDREDTPVSGGNIIARWTRTLSRTSNIEIQTYYDRTNRDVQFQFEENRDTFDFDLKHHFQLSDQHDFVWGLDYQASIDSTSTENRTAQFLPADKTIHLFSAFVQDQFMIVPQRLDLWLGSKFEKNNYTDLEVQPSVRAAWTPNGNQTIWGAISRALRFPTRLDTELRAFTPTGILVLKGNPDFKSEEVISIEAGYRIRPHLRYSLDIATFYNQYDNLITVGPGRAQDFALIIENGTNASVAGVEIASHVEATPWWRLTASITFLNKDVDLDPGAIDLSNAAGEGNDPDYKWKLHSSTNLPENIEFDAIFRYVDDLPQPVVPEYLTLDLRLGWSPMDDLDLSVVGQNLFQRSHPEFGAPTPMRKEVERSVYGQVRWFF